MKATNNNHDHSIKETTITTTSSSDSVFINAIQGIGRIGKVLSWICVLACIYYTQQDLKHLSFLFLFGKFIELLVLPLVAMRSQDDAVVTNVEYHVQTRAILGILSYSVALWYIALPPNNHLLSSYVSGRTKEFVALAFVCGYKQVDSLFTNLYCNPFHYKVLWDTIEDGISTPLSVLVMILVQYGEIEQRHTAMIGAFFIYKMLRLASEYQTAADAKTETKPTPTLFTMSNPYHSKEAHVADDDKFVWRIYGNEYDMTDYVAHHPGGKEAIMLGANRDDATALFQSYHAFNIHKAKTVLEKYRISELSSSSPTISELTSSKHENDLFYNELVERCGKALRDAGVDPVKDRAGTWFRWAVYFIYLSLTAVGFAFYLKGSFYGCVLFSIVGGHVAGQIGHDGGHYAVSRIPLINDVAVWGMFLISNPVIWQHQHTYAHHSFTNHHSRDPDLLHWQPVIRLQQHEPLLRQHKNQSNPLYVFSNFVFVARAMNYTFALRFVLERSIHGAADWSDRRRIVRSFGLLFHLVAYSTIMMIVPFFTYKSFGQGALAAFLAMGLSGAYFALLSQVGHITENALSRDPEVSKRTRHEIAKESWSANQIESTNDFCPQSTLGFTLGAGLGYQIEHHLFPSLNHCHLYLIQPIVEQTAKEYNVQYKSYTTFTDAVKDYLLYVKTMAKVEEKESTTQTVPSTTLKTTRIVL